MFAYHLHTPTQRGRSFVISHNSPCLLIVCRPHRLFALLHCAIHVYTHRFGFRGGSVLYLSLPIQVRIHPTHVATRATYAYALALFVLTRTHSLASAHSHSGTRAPWCCSLVLVNMSMVVPSECLHHFSRLALLTRLAWVCLHSPLLTVYACRCACERGR